MKRNIVAWAALIVSTCALVSSSGLTRPVPAALKIPAESQKTARALSDAFVAVADYSKHSVVQISVQRKGGEGRLQGRRELPPGVIPGPRGRSPEELEKFLGEMLKRFGTPEFAPEPQQFGGGINLGTGSGFVYDDQGHILTNNHVVNGANEIVVKFHDGVEAPAKVVGTDPQSDVAVIKVENTSYPALPRGESHSVQTGELVMAVGSPFGLSQSVTMGIVSATERDDLGITGDRQGYESFIQIDAAINPGNSGGPLVNMDGQVIGINSAIMSGGRSSFGGGGNDGVGFAIPIDLASGIADKLIKDGKVNRAMIGVAIAPVTSSEAKQLGMDSKAKGALVQSVVPDSPAAKAGLQLGDVIVGFDGKPVLSVSNFRITVASSEIGKPYPLKYFRGGKEHSTNVVLGSAEKIKFDPEVANSEPEKESPKDEPNKTKIEGFGLEVQPLTPDLAKGLGVSEEKGLVISKVLEDSPASANGLEEGMVISKVIRNKQVEVVSGVEEFKKLTKDADTLMIYVSSSKIPGAFITLDKAKKD